MDRRLSIFSNRGQKLFFVTLLRATAFGQVLCSLRIKQQPLACAILSKPQGYSRFYSSKLFAGRCGRLPCVFTNWLSDKTTLASPQPVLAAKVLDSDEFLVVIGNNGIPKSEPLSGNK